MPELETKDRNRLRDSSFAWIDKQGERHLPINDESHVRNALARFNQTDFDEPGAKSKAAKKIMSAARKHGIEPKRGAAPLVRAPREQQLTASRAPSAPRSTAPIDAEARITIFVTRHSARLIRTGRAYGTWRWPGQGAAFAPASRTTSVRMKV
jgi:hypothetical protein